ncbi:nicotinate-nucleotide adenylyltransferase [Pantoea sp. 1.19]|uniref:nicotinate-nucleotide adenylyltransferase n=1 Tax=Pantoea sp. 1.19 TaxID=1925589 RepID=UPI000948EF5C|nr:nicotinate-nucleotide adenylyltransferase [Pantoea sp. 1.19]
MSTLPELHALFGGTFDPIHYGHLLPVSALAEETGLSRVTLLPNNVPPHRPQPQATPAQRVAMVRLAIADRPLFQLDTRELDRDAPSWTVETLAQLRAERGDQQPLGFIIGQDSLLTLPRWHRWQALLSLCHLLVLTRPGYATTLPDAAQRRWLEAHRATDVDQLRAAPAGRIWLAATPEVDLSATQIRERLRHGQNCNQLLPPAVAAYIAREGLYRDA